MQNIRRRHLNKGQQAMALAKAYPEPEKGGRGQKGAAKAAYSVGEFSRQYLTRARLVLRVLPSDAD